MFLVRLLLVAVFPGALGAVVERSLRGTASSNATQAPVPGCACRSVNANVKVKPPAAQANTGQALPDCFPEHPVTQATFVTPVSNINTCLMEEGFGAQPIANKLKCLAPDGVVGTKAANAIYLIGDSHSAMLRTGVGSATSMPVFSASWWGSGHAGKVADIEDALMQVVQPGDSIFFAMRWDARSVTSFKADIDVIIRVLQAKAGAHLVIVEDNPVMKSEPATCYMTAAQGKFPTACSRTITDVSLHYPEYKQAVTGYTTAHPGFVHYLETQGMLCDTTTGTCDYNVPGSWAPAYRDTDHLSEDGSRYLSPFICSFMVDNKLSTGGLH